MEKNFDLVETKYEKYEGKNNQSRNLTISPLILLEKNQKKKKTQSIHP